MQGWGGGGACGKYVALSAGLRMRDDAGSSAGIGSEYLQPSSVCFAWRSTVPFETATLYLLKVHGAWDKLR